MPPSLALLTAPPFAAGSATDVGAAAFLVARYALALAGLLAVVYALIIAALTICARWVRR